MGVDYPSLRVRGGFRWIQGPDGRCLGTSPDGPPPGPLPTLTPARVNFARFDRRRKVRLPLLHSPRCRFMESNSFTTPEAATVRSRRSVRTSPVDRVGTGEGIPPRPHLPVGGLRGRGQWCGPGPSRRVLLLYRLRFRPVPCPDLRSRRGRDDY